MDRSGSQPSVSCVVELPLSVLPIVTLTLIPNLTRALTLNLTLTLTFTRTLPLFSGGGKSAGLFGSRSRRAAPLHQVVG